MNPDLREAAKAATRALCDGWPRMFLWWWTSLVVVVVGMAIGREVLGAVESSTWQWASTAPKVLMLIAGILLASVLLPQYVSYGVSRRAFSLAAGLVTSIFILTGALLMVAGYAVEAFVHDAVGWPYAIDTEHLFTGVGQPHLIFLESTLLFVAWATTGWLTAAGYYRWGWLRGSMFCIPAALPLVAAEALMTAFGRQQVTLPLVVAGMVVAALAGAVASYHVSKDMPLRHGAGWTIA